jgi:hypothetical protein
MTAVSKPAYYIAIAASAGVPVFLASLHILSPEFDPSWHMVSEYANGDYGSVLSAMFMAWAVSSWALAYALRSQISKAGLGFLIAAGLGEAMASFFDINHSLHGLSALIGIGSLPVAALLINTQLAKIQPWSDSKRTLLWSAHLTWISVLLMAITFGILIATFMQSGAEMTSEPPTNLPEGVIALAGWANRFLIVVHCAWVMLVAWLRIKSQTKS